MRWWGAVAGLVVLVAACTPTAEDPEPSGQATPPAVASTATTTLQLLYLSDSSGWNTGEAYATEAESALGADVELVDWRVPNLAMVDALRKIEAEPEVVAEADLVVLGANPLGSGVREGAEACMVHPAEAQVVSVEEWRPFADLAGRVLESIRGLREEQPTVLRLTDLYVPDPDGWREVGAFETCMESLDNLSTALEAAAEPHGAIFVSALDVYNGADHQDDPDAKGFINRDGIHPSDAGGRAMARALAATGFSPLS